MRVLAKGNSARGYAVGVSAVLGRDSFWVIHVTLLRFDHLSLLQKNSTMFSSEDLLERRDFGSCGLCRGGFSFLA